MTTRILARCAALALGLMAAPASALAPPLPACSHDLVGAAERRAIGVADPDWFGYYHDPIGADFMIYSFDVDNGDLLVILEHCPSATQLVARVLRRGLSERAFEDRWIKVDSGIRDRASPDNPESYSFQDLARLAAADGAVTRVVQVPYQSCACAVKPYYEQ